METTLDCGSAANPVLTKLRLGHYLIMWLPTVAMNNGQLMSEARGGAPTDSLSRRPNGTTASLMNSKVDFDH